MNRRVLLALGTQAAALALVGRTGQASTSGRPPLVPVGVSWERVREITVGLRPHRPAGFRVEVEKLGERTVIHHYGHGGAGMSMSWGTAWLAADLARQASARRSTAAILGAGVVGLTTARQLQRSGFLVTLYASALPPNTTSNRSLACWSPSSSLLSVPEPSAAFLAQFPVAADIALKELQRLARRGDQGVSWLDAYTASDQSPTERPPHRLVDPLAAGEVILGAKEHPFPTVWATVRPTLRIEPALYLDALVREVYAAGGRILERTFVALPEVLALPEEIIVNCTGLGAGALFNDAQLTPIKGQLTRLSPQPGVDYCMMSMQSGNESFLHMMPRSDGILLGGLATVGDGTLEPDVGAQESMIAAHQRFFTAMGS